jgi:hypothetical protein
MAFAAQPVRVQMELICLSLMMVVFLLIDRIASQPVMQPVRILDRDSQKRMALIRAERERGE